jgi:ubiquinone/menaquinone biosynthesis C-methylase UbiE
VSIEPMFVILDVGCGGGQAITALSTMATEGKVYGVDYSATSVAAARSLNERAIAAGKVDVRQASVSKLPFSEDKFDLITAIETHYYWPDPVLDLREIWRVLKPGGTVAIIAETYRGERFGWAISIPMKLLRARYLSVDEHRLLFEAAGFGDVAVHTELRRGWICAVGRKPGALGYLRSDHT